MSRVPCSRSVRASGREECNVIRCRESIALGRRESITCSRLRGYAASARQAPRARLRRFGETAFAHLFGRGQERIACLAEARRRRARAGGEVGIRTLDSLTTITVFETAAFDHSATSPK